MDIPIKKISKILSIIIVIVGVVVFLFFFYRSAYKIRINRTQLYNSAIAELEQGNYEDALEGLKDLGNFGDTQKDIKFSQAMLLFEKGNIEESINLFNELGDYRGSDQLSDQLVAKSTEEANQKSLYNIACQFYACGQYAQAYWKFKELGDYEDSVQFAQYSERKWRLQLSNTISAGVGYSGGVSRANKAFISDPNFADQLEIENWSDVVSISAGNAFVAGLKNDGTVVVGYYSSNYRYPVDVSKWEHIVAISVGDQFIVGLKSDGTLISDGIDGYGETEVETEDWKNIVAIDTGWQHTVGLDKDGKIHFAGYIASSNYTTNICDIAHEIDSHSEDWTNLVAISTGGSTGADQEGAGHIVALRKDGRVVAAGDNSYGQCNVSDWKNIVAISAGAFHTVGLTADGQVLTTQSKEDYSTSNRIIEEWNESCDTVAVSAGFGYTLRLTSSGNVDTVGYNDKYQDNITTWENLASYESEWNSALIDIVP